MKYRTNQDLLEQRAWNRKMKRDIRGKNLFILRELVQFVCLQEKVSINDYYYYLFNELVKKRKDIMKKCADRYYHMVYDTGFHNIEQIKDKFIECGISEQYFDDVPIKFSDDSMYGLEAEIDEYIATICDNGGEDVGSCEGALAALRESITLKYDEILNLDNSPMINSIRLLVNNIIRYRRNELSTKSKGQALSFSEVYELSEIFTEAIPVELYNEKQYEKIYANLIAEYTKNRQLHISVYVKPSSTKNIYNSKEGKENTQINYLLIRTAFNLFCEMDTMISQDSFYRIVEMTKEEYDSIIVTGVADNVGLSKRLLKYHFPVNMFRGDNPKCVSVHPRIKQIAKDRINNHCSEEEYIRQLREQLLYINRVENVPFIISIYSMYKEALPQREIE